ncbi:MAG: hypothetical protein J6N49_00420 [Alphaproteobacteria bacterium]|nr:hypothetical protein [Alphaproteobacteria bacterium]
MSKKSANTAALIEKVCKRKEEVKNLRKPPEERDQPIRPSQVHETPKNNPKHDRKQGKKLSRQAMRGDYE